MKPSAFQTLSCALGMCAALFLSSVRSRAEAPLTAAVFNFQTAGDKLTNKGAEVAALLNAQLSQRVPEVNLVERQELDKVFGEQELGLSGTVTPDTAAKVGSLIGAKVLITGRLFDAGGKFYLTAKIMGTETGRVYGESVMFNDLSALDKAVEELGSKVAADIKQQGETLVAKVEKPAERLERLKKLVNRQGLLPSVSVVIKEQHISRLVLDPAAQTEMKLILQQLGFEVIDPQTSSKSPDVAITGEAFSEPAGRRGNLISCRARVEIRVTRTATGKLLLADRQTDVAVDLAEQTAGKTALENATSKMLERVAPVLTGD
jgi:hypothetical protein